MAGIPVILNVYDVSGHPVLKNANKLFRALGAGAYHAAVEINGEEWSYGFTDEGTGVFTCGPRECEAHSFRESIPIGATTLSQEEVTAALDALVQTWQGPEYDILRHNCCHYSNAMLRALGLPEAPSWVTRSAAHAAAVVTPLEETIAEGKMARGGENDGYKFGDVSRGLVASGKASRGAAPDSGYKFGDLTRGVISKLTG
ncbi:desi2 [Symbiodinium pilosum]|uniref:Desi2 protein n=1 Tax=Symbiodinium pilosum TaxID=2952 RepID=A0A812VMN8_SYMPI|nr:desi2 [Symbiodinium pilosum]